MIQKIIKLSDYPLLSKLINDGKTITAIDKQNFYVTLDKIKGKKIVYSKEYEADRNSNERENTIELGFDTKENVFFKLYNGLDGDKGLVGDKGPQGDQGESFNSRNMEERGAVPLPIVNNDTTDNSQAIWSAYRGKVMEDFLKSIAETIMSDEEYQLLFNEQEEDEFGNKNEYHQIFIDMEFITDNDEQATALVHTDNKAYKTYVKYWTYENESAISYFRNIGTAESPVYEEVLGFDLWNDLYLNEDNTETYYTRKLVVTSVDPISGEVLTSEYQYTPIEVPIWLDLEFTTDNEDKKTIILSAVDGTDDGDVSKDEQEEEIQILYRPITNIKVDGNNEITIPINKIITKNINITPSNYVNAYIVIEYDENYIKVFEDGRIMALNKACPAGTTIKISAMNKNINGEYVKSNTIFDTITVRVVIYVEDIRFDSYNIEGLKGTTYTLLPKPNDDAIAPTGVIYYEVVPKDASNKTIEFISSNSEYVEVDKDENNNTVLIFKEEGEVTIYANAIDGSKFSSQFTALVITPVNEIIIDDIYDDNNMDALLGYTKNINARILPENATHKELIWSIKEEDQDLGNSISVADDRQTGQLFVASQQPFTIIVSSKDGVVSKEILVNPRISVYNINLNIARMTIDLHEKYQLIAEINENAYNKKLLWTSSNENVLTVTQDGLVEAVGGGDAVITVSATDGSTAVATCEITSVVLITNITLQQNIKYHLGNNYNPIEYTITPTNANITNLTWYTSDESIATVNNGQVRMIKEGKVKVYAVANDNSGIIASTNVEITVPTNKLLLVNDELTYNESDEDDKFYELTINVDENFTIVSIVEPDNTSNQNLQYVISDPNDNNIVYVDNNGNITALSQGTATLFVKTTDNTDLSQKLKINVL